MPERPRARSAAPANMEAVGSSPAGGDDCGLCLAGRARYTCPRCRVRVCSVPCYRGHGSCARDFQSRELQLRLRGQRCDEASRRRLTEALLRLRELREPGDAHPQLGLDPSSEQAELEVLWGQLSPEQRKAFQRMLSSGEISGLLPPWKPWWLACSGGAALIQELPPTEAPQSPGHPHEAPQCPLALQQPPPQETAAGTQSLPQPAGVLNSVPAMPASIPGLASLTGLPLSPLVRFQLPNVLYAYAYSLSLYNGDVDETEVLPEFCETVLDVSGALGAKQSYHSTAEALQAALQAVTADRYPECPLGNAGVMLAVAQLLMGECQAKQKGFSLAALAHLARLLSKGKRWISAEDRPKMFRAQKKCEFLLSWVNENEVALTLLALEVQREYKSHLDMVKEVGAVTQELEKMWGAKVPPAKKTLIEELD